MLLHNGQVSLVEIKSLSLPFFCSLTFFSLYTLCLCIFCFFIFHIYANPEYLKVFHFPPFLVRFFSTQRAPLELQSDVLVLFQYTLLHCTPIKEEFALSFPLLRLFLVGEFDPLPPSKWSQWPDERVNKPPHRSKDPLQRVSEVFVCVRMVVWRVCGSCENTSLPSHSITLQLSMQIYTYSKDISKLMIDDNMMIPVLRKSCK